jgi:outer membrane protein OmpA-like peptidoglycan-associated protein
MALGLGALLAAQAAPAQALMGDVSVDDLVSALGGGAQAKAFRRTAPPDVSTSICAGSGGAGGKNLVVVPYAGDGAPSAQLAIQFVTNSDQLGGNDTTRLRVLARALNHPNLGAARFAVAGHTDGVGPAAVNLELSCARAIAARNFLVAQGVAPDRLSAYGFGSNRRLDPTLGPSAVNRRVEIRRAGD